MDPIIGGALIGGAINAGGLVFNQMQGKKNRDFTQQMYERQKGDNVSLWNMQNAYNSPESMMKRFTDAGLNPHLVMGQGFVQANMNSTPMQNSPLPYADVSGLANMATMVPQQRNIVAQTERTKQQTIGEALQNESQFIDNNLKTKYAELETIQRIDQNSSTIDNLKATFESTKQTTLNLKENQLILQQNAKLLQEDINGKKLINAISTIDLEYKKQVTELDVLSKQLKNTKEQTEINQINQQIEESKSRIQNLNRSTELLGTTIKLNQQQFDFLTKVNPLKLSQADLDLLKTMIQNNGYLKQNQLTDVQKKAIQSDTRRHNHTH